MLADIPFVSIEGNIGSGKSTLLGSLTGALRSDEVVIIHEPVEEWVEKGLLQALYDGHLPAEVFQYAALAGINRATLEALRSVTSKTKLILAERSLFSNKEVFARAVMPNVISRRAFEYAWEAAMASLPRMNFIRLYVRTPPDICLQRIAMRSRESEAAITAEYLEHLSALHEDWCARELQSADPASSNWIFLEGDMPTDAVSNAALQYLLRLMS